VVIASKNAPMRMLKPIPQRFTGETTNVMRVTYNETHCVMILRLSTKSCSTSQVRTKSMTYLQPRSVSLAGRRTTVRLEDAYWNELHRMSSESGQTIPQILAAIDAEQPSNFTSAIRVRVVANLRMTLMTQQALVDQVTKEVLSAPKKRRSPIRNPKQT
jgi:predicted DNA-binding ribbon-helix-helix protein